MGRPLWRENYKSDWCVACTGDRNKSGIWAHWERKDGLTLCGEWHKPEDYPMSVTVADVKAQYEREKTERLAEEERRRSLPVLIKYPDPMEYVIRFEIKIPGDLSSLLRKPQ